MSQHTFIKTLTASSLALALCSTSVMADSQDLSDIERQLATKTTSTMPSPAHAPSQSNPTTTEHLVGLGSGALFGAAVAGPVGAAVGGLMGLFIAEDQHQDQKIAQLQDRNTQLAYNLASQQRLLDKAQSDESDLVASTFVKEPASPKHIPQILNMVSHVQFVSGSATIPTQYYPQLDLIAALLANHQHWQVDISGYADPLGDPQTNQALSTQRAEQVKHYLSQKLASLEFNHDEHILTRGFGAIQPSEPLSIDERALARHAAIHIKPLHNELVASATQE